MAIPDRPSAELQVWPGHAPVPSYETPMARVGRKGLNLVAAIDDLEPEQLARMQNVRSTDGGPLEVRPGQTTLGTTAGTERNHSLFRLNDPGAGAFARFSGSSTDLYRGTTGAFTSVDGGYSGDPLGFCGVTMPLAGTPYAIVSDRSRQRKVARTGPVEALGIVPGLLTSTALVAQSRKEICAFEAGDPDGASAAANWTATAGRDRAATPNASGAPVLTDVFAGLGLQAVTVPGAATTGYDSFIGIARTLNLDFLDAANTIPATDDDQIHLLFNVSDPQYLEEIKIYFVCNAAFSAASIPGTGGANSDAWFKSFRPNDLQDYFERTQSGLTASEDLRERELLEQFKLEQPGDARASIVNVTGSLDINRQDIPQIAAGRNIWGEFGIMGVPLRRGEFSRIGTDTTRGWSTITGIIIVLQTSAVQPITFQFDTWFLYGGSGPDNSDVGATGYDVRVINWNPATGSKGNPSAVQAASAYLNALRQSILVTPTATGIAALRQRAYLRGGSALGTQDWYFAGENAADGGTITITVNDNARILAETLEIDNDMPITSVNSAGATVLNQTVPIYFQVESYTFALGDPNQPGRLYRSKLGRPENWPADEYEDVCPSTDELLNGGAYASQGFVFSRSRMYSILLGNDGEWTTEPTACSEGLVGRWAMAVTPYGIAFISPYGVRLTQGGVPDRLSDELIEPLFNGITAGGLSPIDFTVPTALQLAYADGELWLTYQDTGAVRRHLIWSFFDKSWRSYSFTTPVATVYAEPVQGAAATILLGSNAAGAIYTHSGFSDLGVAIPFLWRTGCGDFGDPRREKTLGEIILDASWLTDTVTVQAFLNDEITNLTAQTVVGIAGQRRYTFEPFGTAPQRARNVSIQVSGNASTSARPFTNLAGVSYHLEPEIIYKLPTPWEELPGGEGYVWGLLLTCDTFNTSCTAVVEYTTNNGSVTIAASIQILADGRKKLPFTWNAVLAQQIRLRLIGDCIPWIRYKIEWLSDPEPPRVVGWDTNWESFGTYADKWLKGYLIEADTFGQPKTVVVDVDQSNAVVTQTLTFTGRSIQHIAFAKTRGRLFRLRATDSSGGKFYRWQPIFDEEPLAITRWEGQERPFQGLEGRWQKPMEAFICVRSSATVTWRVTTYGAGGTVLNTSDYTLASTGGVKAKVRVPMNAVKGLLFAPLFTSGTAFWLYKEESEVLVEDWASGQAAWVPLIPANDDLDPARQMGNASVAAATPGGA